MAFLVWGSTHDKLKNKHSKLAQELIDESYKLRVSDTKISALVDALDESQRANVKFEKDTNQLRQNAQASNNKLSKVLDEAAALKKDLYDSKEYGKDMFSRSGAYAGQFTVLRKKVQALTKICDLKDLQRRLAEGDKRKARKAKKKTAKKAA